MHFFSFCIECSASAAPVFTELPPPLLLLFSPVCLFSEDGKFKEAGTKIHAGVDEEAELNKMHAYLKWVAALNSISSDLQQLVDCDGMCGICSM